MDPAATTTMWLRFREEYRTGPDEEWEWEELGLFDSIESAEGYADDRGHEILDSRSWCNGLTWFVEERPPDSVLEKQIIEAQNTIEYQTKRINRYKKILMGF